MANVGVYIIKNKMNNNLYIGSTINLDKRVHQHFSALRYGKHFNRHLQSAFNKYGEENFEYKIILKCDKENMVFYEQALIDFYSPVYNKRKDASTNSGIEASETAKNNMSKAHLGKKNPHTLEWNKKIGLSNKGRKLDNEWKLHISLAHKSSEKVKARHNNPENKKNLSNKMKAVWKGRKEGKSPMPIYVIRRRKNVSQCL